MKGTFLGEFEELVLLVVGVLDAEAYGVSIKDELERQTGRRPSVGALHSALTRLEKKNYVQSVMEGATEDRRGRRKRYYRLTGAGREALQAVYEQRTQLYHLIPNLGHGQA